MQRRVGTNVSVTPFTRWVHHCAPFFSPVDVPGVVDNSALCTLRLHRVPAMVLSCTAKPIECEGLLMARLCRPVLRRNTRRERSVESALQKGSPWRGWLKHPREPPVCRRHRCRCNQQQEQREKKSISLNNHAESAVLLFSLDDCERKLAAPELTE